MKPPYTTPNGPARFAIRVVSDEPVWIAYTSFRTAALYMIELTYADVHLSKPVRDLAYLHWPDPDSAAWLCWSSDMWRNDAYLLWEYEPMFDHVREQFALSAKQFRDMLENTLETIHPGWITWYQRGFKHHE